MPPFLEQRESSWTALYIGSDIYQTWFLSFTDAVKTPDIARYQPSQSYVESTIGRSEVVLVSTLFSQTSLKQYNPGAKGRLRLRSPLRVAWRQDTSRSVERRPNFFRNLLNFLVVIYLVLSLLCAPLVVEVIRHKKKNYGSIRSVRFTFPKSGNMWGNSSS
jgi:hypothetical protein